MNAMPDLRQLRVLVVMFTSLDGWIGDTSYGGLVPPLVSALFLLLCRNVLSDDFPTRYVRSVLKSLKHREITDPPIIWSGSCICLAVELACR